MYCAGILYNLYVYNSVIGTANPAAPHDSILYIVQIAPTVFEIEPRTIPNDAASKERAIFSATIQYYLSRWISVKGPPVRPVKYV